MSKIVKVDLVGDNKKLLTSLTEAGAVAEAESKHIGDSVEAGSAKAGGAFAKLGSAIQNVTGIPIGDAFSKVGTKMGEVESKGQSFGKSLSAVGGGLMLGLGGALVGVGGLALGLADKFEPVHASLVAAVKASGSSFDVWSGKIAATTDKMATFGFTTTDVQGALAASVVATQNTGKSLGIMGLAADLAKMKHVDLTTAMMAVTRATEGNLKPLKQLGIDLPIAATSALKLQKAQDAVTAATDASNAIIAKYGEGVMNVGDKHNPAYEASLAKVTAAHDKLTKATSTSGVVMDALSHRLQGQAATSAETMSGKMAALHAQVTNVGTKIGVALVPKLEELMNIVMKVITWLEHHKAVAEALAIVIGGVVMAAIGAFIVGLFTAGGALAFLMSPITLVVAAIAVLAFGIYEVYKHWGAIWGEIKRLVGEAIHAVIGIFKSWYPLILGVLSGGVLLLPLLIFQHWKTISSDAAKILNDVVGFFTGLPGRIVAGLGDIVGTIWGVLKSSATWIDTNVLQPTIAFFTGLPTRVVTGLGNIVGTIWNALKTSATWIDTNVLQPVVTYFKQLPARLLSGLGNIVAFVFGGLSGAWTWIDANVITPIVSGFEGLPNAIANGIMGALGALGSIGKAILNPIITGIDTAIDHINSATSGIPLIGSSLHIPDIPLLASGTGMSKVMGLAVVGEKGPELVNFGQPAQVIPNSAIAGISGGGGGSTSSSTGPTITFMPGSIQSNANPNDIATELGYRLRVA